MPRVLCVLPFAGAEINGVAFAPAEGGMLSEEVPAEVAAAFLRIPGYHLAAEAPRPAAGPGPAESGAAAAPPPVRSSRRKAT